MRHTVNASASFDLFMRDVRNTRLLDKDEEIALAKAIEAGVYAQHLIDSGQADPDLIEDLKVVISDGVQAKKDFVESNIRLVISIAKKYIASGIEIGELIHDGALGLIRAVEKFDYTAGIKFSTYATYWIRQFIYRKKPEYTHIVHLPPSITNTLHKLRTEIKRLGDESGHIPNEAELAELVGLRVDELSRVRSYSQPWLSFQYSNTFDDGDSKDFVEGCLIPDSSPTPDLIVEDSSLMSALRACLGRLDETQRRAIELRFGLNDGIEHSYQDISKIMGVPRGIIRRSVSMAINIMATRDGSRLKDYYMYA